MVKRLKKQCPSCNKKGKGLIGMFDEVAWCIVWVCQLCGNGFTEKMDGNLVHHHQYAIKRSDVYPARLGRASNNEKDD